MTFYPVTVETRAASPTAVVSASTTWAEFPNLWGKLLDDVYTFVRAGGATQGGHNIMLYKDDVPNVEVGIQVVGPFEGDGHVVCSALPAGEVASTVHHGGYSALDEAHAAVKAWCQSHGHTLTKVRWEIYGDPQPGTGQVDVEVCWQLA